ncbi:MAG: hypothetical protein BYD32DRAFT_474970 [Podila humilis]|nr:MAG: hypothetical protein BYD32DRAFT_474970 [Podila humilis]
MPGDLLPPAVHELATLTLGIDFDADHSIRMTALQYSVTRKEDLNFDCFGNNSNVFHLAAFLDLRDIIELLMMHGVDSSLLNGQGLSSSDIIDAVKAANAVFPSIGSSEDFSETGSIISETKALDYFGFRGDEDHGGSEDIEDDSLTIMDRSWDSSEYPSKWNPCSYEQNTTSFESSLVGHHDYTSPRIYHLSFDSEKTPPTRTFGETSAIPSLDHIYLAQSIFNTQTLGPLDHYHADSFDPESFNEEPSDENDLYSTSFLYKIRQLPSPAWDRPSKLYSAMRHDRRFGFPSATYVDYLSSLSLIPRAPTRVDSFHKVVHWDEGKEIIVFRRHLQESTELESNEESDEEAIAAFQQTWVYHELGLDLAYFLDESGPAYDSIPSMMSFDPSDTSVEDDEEEDRSLDSASSVNSFYGLSQTNVSTNDLRQASGASGAKATVFDRPLPKIPAGVGSETSTLPPTSKRQNLLQRRTPSPPKLSLDTPGRKPFPVMQWQSQPEVGLAFNSVHDPRMSTALKSPPPPNLPPSLLAGAPPMLVKLLKKFPEGSHASSTLDHAPVSVDKNKSLAPPRCVSGLCRSRSKTNLAQHLVDMPPVSSAVDFDYFKKELPSRPKTWSSGARVMSALKTFQRFLSPPPSPSLIAPSSSSLSLSLPRHPRQSRSVRPASLVIPRPLDSAPPLSQILGKMASSCEDIRAMSNRPGTDSNMPVIKVTSPLANMTSTYNAIDLLQPSVASRLLRSDSDRARSPQLYPHQQIEEPTTTVIPTNSSSTQKHMSLDSTVDQRLTSTQSDAGGDQTNKNIGFHDQDTEDGTELIHGVLQAAAIQGEDMAYLGSALINIQGIAHGLPIQSYNVRRSKDIQLFSDCTERCAMDIADQAHKPRFNVWTFSSALPKSPRVTLSNCESPSSIKTGVLFMRIKSFADFALPVPAEGAMASIRIDTGLEKVDTDYVPLKDIEMLFNQEFCIPVTPDLALTMTLHLMQSPHLHPRSLTPARTATISECTNLEDTLLVNHLDHRDKRAPHDSGISFFRSPDSTLSWRATAATISSRTSRSFASLFQRQNAQTNRSSKCSSDDDDGIRAASGVGSIYPSSIDESSSTSSANAPPRQSMVSLASVTKSTIAKWKRNILTPSSRKKKPSDFDTSVENEISPEQDDKTPAILYPGIRARLDASLPDLPVLAQHQGSSLSLPQQLSMKDIHSSETPLQILSRHTLFEDENCIARSGIMFEDLRAACVNQIVRVEFLSINNWADRTDYSVKGSRKAQQSQKQEIKDNGNEDNDTTSDDLVEGEFMVGKILTSLCFLPGQAMDPEDALYEDESRIPAEPQNMLECQQGLYHFQWQSQITHQGRLFYLTECNVWVEGLFRIVGSKLWRCHYRSNSDTQDDEDDNLEMVAYLDLESVTSIQTNLGIFATKPSNLEEQESGQIDTAYCGMNFEDEKVPFYAVNNSFRMHMMPAQALDDTSDVTAGMTPRCQDFYAATSESGQAWLTAIMASCQNRPPTPYWLHSKDEN